VTDAAEPVTDAAEPLRDAAGTARVAVVTGAGSGIGRCVARALLADGWRVALAGRRKDRLTETTRGCASPGTALTVPTDVTSEQDVVTLFDLVRREWGRVDLLVNNAGTSGSGGSADKVSLADWQRVVDTNLTGSFLCAKHAMLLMKEQDPRGGRIINNGSLSAHTPRPASVAYTATKHAITGLTKSIALDGRRLDIACGQIDIGNAATEMTARFGEGLPQASGSVVAEPTFDAQHVADAVRYMANLPLDTNVLFLTIAATKMPFVGRGLSCVAATEIGGRSLTNNVKEYRYVKT
jgi:NADP-dependent 3-hydroxy acid dehydrogenase YdfG